MDEFLGQNNPILFTPDFGRGDFPQFLGFRNSKGEYLLLALYLLYYGKANFNGNVKPISGFPARFWFYEGKSVSAGLSNFSLYVDFMLSVFDITF